MDSDFTLAHELVMTMVDFIENGDVSTILDEEVDNYFTMCQQLEVYYGKFKLKGMYMSFDTTTAALSLSTSNSNNTKYDLSCLADKLFEKFCLLDIDADKMKYALNSFIRLYGIDRFSKCIQKLATHKNIYYLENVVNRGRANHITMEATILMEGYECLISSPRDQHRAKSLIKELIVDDECAETVVSMFAVQGGLDHRACNEVKKLLLSYLEDKFMFEPNHKVWIKMMKSLAIIEAVNTFKPLLKFIIKVIVHFSRSITDYGSTQVVHSPSAIVFDYRSLNSLMIKLYRNENSKDAVRQLVFEQCDVNSQMWTTISTNCKRLPPLEDEQTFYDYTSLDVLKRSIEWKN